MKKGNGQKIVVGVSGGLDSTVSLLRLKEAGWSPVGVTLQVPAWEGGDAFKTAEAARVCEKLGVPHVVVNVKEDFEERVGKYFRKELRNNFTPNPCVVCNRFLKFKELLRIAEEKEVSYVATGHYVQKRFNSNTERYELLKGKDQQKDQSYMLSFLNQEQLRKAIFPIGELTYAKVQEIARNNNLEELLEKESSQDFCYLKRSSFSDYINQELPSTKGNIVNQEGEVLGQHPGLYYYTRGQRKGLDLSGGPYYVLGFNPENNEVVVTKNKDDLQCRSVIVSPFNFISGDYPTKKQSAEANIRYNQTPQPATIYPPQEGRLKISFDKPFQGVSPGQFCVFYKGEVCLGGGRITEINS